MKLFHLLAILLLGFYLMPGRAFACENKSENYSFKIEKLSKSEKIECCNINSHSHNKNQNPCTGKCKNTCICTIACGNFWAIFDSVLKINNYDTSSEKQKIDSYNSSILAGFSSLWLIPKISY